VLAKQLGARFPLGSRRRYHRNQLRLLIQGRVIVASTDRIRRNINDLRVIQSLMTRGGKFRLRDGMRQEPGPGLARVSYSNWNSCKSCNQCGLERALEEDGQVELRLPDAMKGGQEFGPPAFLSSV